MMETAALQQRMSGSIRAIAIVMCGLLAGPAPAQDYPNRAVKIVVPGAPGDASDIVARLLAQKLSERMGQQFVVEDKAGAGGILGSEFVARSAPDGYTLILAHAASHGINAAVYSKLPYDPQKDFTPI